MTTSKTRSKSKKQSSNKEAKLHDIVKIVVEDLRHGDLIATVFQEDPLTGAKRAVKTKKIEKLSECPSKWRTHVHINKTECYDMRTHVWVAV